MTGRAPRPAGLTPMAQMGLAALALAGAGLTAFLMLRSSPVPPASVPVATAPQSVPPAPTLDPKIKAVLDGMRAEAATLGLSERTLSAAFVAMARDGDVLEAAAAQPEHTRTAGEYVELLVSPERIALGRDKLASHADVLARIEAQHGVDRHVLVAIWGIESNYGVSMGTRSVIRSLATLAAEDTRRPQFWRAELIAALKIIEAGDIAADRMTGSWAGAMGHTQFMPSTYLTHAIDFDRDGRRDIWETPADALASAANYLRASGWVSGQAAMHEVTLPAGFDFAHSDPVRPRQPWPAWQGLGVKAAGNPEPGADAKLRLVLPAGAKGPAFLATASFNAILRYNNAVPYALAVALLADRLAGRSGPATAWPAGERALNRAEREELQRRLAARTHDTGGIDGVIGVATRAAIRVYQKASGLAEDGHPSLDLLQRLRRTDAP